MSLDKIKLSKDERGRWILRCDASLLTLSNCERRVYLLAIRGLTKDENRESADYGTAAHKVLGAWYGGAGVVPRDQRPPAWFTMHQKISLDIGQEWFRANVQTPESSWKTLAHFTNLMDGYFKEYAEQDGLVAEAIEQRFEYLWYEDDLVVVYLCGTKDFVGTYNGEPVIVDHKSNTPFGFKKREELISAELESYQTKIQGKVYVLHEKLANNKDYGFMINGLFLEKAGKNTYRRSEIYHWPENDMSAFHIWLAERINDIILDFKLELREIENDRADSLSYYFHPNFTVCDGEKWPCDYRPLCMAKDDEHRELLASVSYKCAERNPLFFQQ